ncbi:MAG: glycosyltransferase [Candidatus Moraniibacteriota bacterium]
MNPAISFIFVNYQSADLLRSSLASLRAVVDTQINAEYIVINNDLREREALERLAAHAPGLRVAHQECNLGFGVANNFGGQLATGDILFFINPDTELLGGHFPSLIKAFEFRPRAIYGMALMQSDGRRECWSAGRFPGLWRVCISNIIPMFLSQPWRATTVTRTDWVSGAACAIRRDYFLSLGGFDPTFFLYFEDVDLARRATLQGAWVGVYPFIVFRHAGGQSHGSQKAKKSAYYAGQRRYFERWRPGYERRLLAAAHKLADTF